MPESFNESFVNLSWSSTIDVTEPTPRVPSDSGPLDWQEAALAMLLCLIIIITVVGNTLVILAVGTTRRLRTVTNCYVMSLAVADFLVGVFVMPPAVAVRLVGSWELGSIVCDIWISLDVMCCTASILSLCAISVDRYLAVTQPLHYSRRRRSKKLALLMICIVWVAAIAITCPPIFGWYDKTHHVGKTCRYNQNTGYVIFSAMGSFFIPLIVMLYVYARISCVVANRHDKLGGQPGVSRASRKGLKLHSGYEESECLDRPSMEADDTHPQPSLVKCSGEQYTTSLHPQRSIRFSQHSQSCLYSNNHNTRASVYGGPMRTLRPPTLPLDMSTNNRECSSRVSSFRRESKTTQTLTIVVGGFVACWLPFFVTYLITPFLPGPVPALLMALLTWLGWVNSAINPFIYAFYSVDFRTAFWRLTLRHCSSTHKAQNLSHLDSRHK